MHERVTRLGLATLLLGLGMLHCGPVPPPGTGGAAGQAVQIAELLVAEGRVDRPA